MENGRVIFIEDEKLKGKRNIKSKDLVLSPNQRSYLINKLENKKHRIIFILGCYSGLRVSEIIQCRFSWLRFEMINNKRILEINIPKYDRDIKNKNKLWVSKNTKKKKVKLKDIGKERTTYIFENEFANEVYFWYENNPLGINMTRQNITSFVVQKEFMKILLLEYKDLDKITTHSLRATFQNYCKFEKGFDDTFIQLILGHEDISITLNHYRTMNKESGKSYLVGYMS